MIAVSVVFILILMVATAITARWSSARARRRMTAFLRVSPRSRRSRPGRARAVQSMRSALPPRLASTSSTRTAARVCAAPGRQARKRVCSRRFPRSRSSTLVRHAARERARHADVASPRSQDARRSGRSGALSDDSPARHAPRRCSVNRPSTAARARAPKSTPPDNDGSCSMSAPTISSRAMC